MSYLLLVRHGESRWNLANKFTGWVDVPLSEVGVHEGLLTASKVKDLDIDVAFASHLIRAQATLLLILSEQDRTGIFLHEDEHKWMRFQANMKKHDIPVHTSPLLNERYYGLLQGLDKGQAAKKFGYKKVYGWRRSWDGRPPRGESLKDVYKRVLPYFKSKILTEVKKGKNVLVVAHGNSLRAIIKYLESISDEEIANLELAPAQPFIYKWAQGKLKRAHNGLSFDRPVYWEPPTKPH